MRSANENLLYDYEEPRGRLQIFLHRTRWKWILIGIMALSFTIPLLIAAHLSPSSVDGIEPARKDDSMMPMPSLAMSPAKEHRQQPRMAEVQIPWGRVPSTGIGPRRNGRATEYKAQGEGDSQTSMKNFSDFEGLLSSCSSSSGSNGQLRAISLKNFFLDAEQFSQSLEGCSKLESLKLENIWLIGNFSRVTLPNLKEFVYVQNGEDPRDSYKSPETLQQTLFFDKVPPPQQIAGLASWNVSEDLLNLGVDITLSKGGTKLIDIRRQDGEIYLNVEYCEDVLVNVKGPYDSLTLIRCNVTTASLPAIPGTLKYLNIRNSVQATPLLADLIRKQTKLEELYLFQTFHCIWPGYEVYLNLNDLPQALTKLGMNNADITSTPAAPGGTLVPPTSIKQLTIGDFTTPSTVSKAFPSLFPNLDRINIVNMSDPSLPLGYSIAYQAIKMKVREIAVLNLHRNYSSVIENQEEILQVESVLDRAGFPKQSMSSFLLQFQLGDPPGTTSFQGISYSARELSIQERHQIRYEGLGFDKMDSFEDYVKWDSLQY